MSDTVDSRSQFTIVLSSPPEVLPGGQVLITPDEMTSVGAKEEWLSFAFTATSLTISPSALNIPPPVTGTFIGLMTSSTNSPGGSITFTPSIAGVDVPGGAVALTSSDASGTVARSAPTTGNEVTLGGPVLRVVASVATPGNQFVVLLVGFRRA